jgi:transposase InsO family protein
VAALRASGPAGIADGRSQRAADPLGGVDERWLQMCRLVLAEHTEASRPTKELMLRRISARLAAEHGEGAVAEPGRRRAHAVLAELTRGSNAFTGSTKGKRSIAARPQGVYGRLRPARPGEFLLLDTTPLDVFAMEPVTLRWVRTELTIAMDLYSRAITGLRLSPVSTKSVDAALVLFEALRPGSRQHTSGGLLPYAGLPDLVAVGDGTAGLAGVAAETIVVDHGKIYLSDHLLSVCQRLGISVQPARPYTPTDKAAVERFFRTLSEGLLAALPGYKGPDVYSRGKDPEGCTYFFTDELEQVIREWISGIYHRRPHAGLADPQVPGLEFSPAEMLAHGTARAGRVKIPLHPGMVFDFLPVAWRTIQHYGVEVGGLRYNGPALTRYRNRTSPFTGMHAGKWPVRYDTDDVSRVWFQDPDGNIWHELAWEHAEQVGVPFSADALAHARRLALAEGRHVDDRRALAELLDRWDAGLVRHPAERRMAVRASQQRDARLAAAAGGAAAEVAALPTVAALTDAGQATPVAPGPWPGSGQPGGDDDSDGELDAASDGDFYADAFEVLT